MAAVYFFAKGLYWYNDSFNLDYSLNEHLQNLEKSALSQQPGLMRISAHILTLPSLYFLASSNAPIACFKDRRSIPELSHSHILVCTS